jgi:hypothetical protein
MYYYNVPRVNGVSGKATPLTKEEYEVAVYELVDDISSADTSCPMVNYYEDGFLLRVEDELRLVELTANYYKVSITRISLKVSRVTKQDYDDIASKIDGFNILDDVITVNGDDRYVISYYFTETDEGPQVYVDVIEEGFYIAMENEELSTFKWKRNYSGILNDN